MASLTTLLSTVLAGELVFDKRQLFELEETTSVEEALKNMREKNVRALPVFRRRDYGRVYTGIISSFDLTSFIAFAAYFKDLVQAHSDEERAKVFGELKIATTPIKDLVGQVSTEGHRLLTFEPTQNLLTVISYLFKGIHRALVEQRDDHTGLSSFKLLSQTDIINFLAANMDNKLLRPTLSKHLDELGLCNPLGKGTQEQDLATISVKDTALEGFRLMYQRDVQALPVVDDKEAIVTTLSTSDTKGIDAQNITSCLLPVLEFLKQIHGGQCIHPITCSPKATLGDVLLKMKTATFHRHQVWVVNSAMKPIGVVSMTDVLRTLHILARKEGQ
jgi:CBS-domain-containing membrane protein